MNLKNIIEKYNFETGDILLFEHINQSKSISDYLFNFIDNTIKWVSNSKYNHVGMIIHNPPWNTKLKGYYLLESNQESIKDSEDHQLKVGVQLIPLEYVLKETYNKLYLRKLHCVRDTKFNEKLINIHKIIHNKPYDFDLVDWIKAALHIDKPDNKKEQKTNSFWCSALVSFVMCKLGFLNKDIPWSIISPKQLGTENKKTNLQFINCTIDDEIEIKI